MPQLYSIRRVELKVCSSEQLTCADKQAQSFKVPMAVAKILAAANPFARLELEPEAVDVAVVRSHYRRLALAVHPDKCKELAKKGQVELQNDFVSE